MDDPPQPRHEVEIKTTTTPASPRDGREREKDSLPPAAVEEIGGPEGPEPTRYGDWERKGRCIDF